MLQKLGEGKRREINWQAMAEGAITAFNTDTTTRGFTGHEMIDSVGLIHMNGRVYDPTLGRFLSADPNVQALDNLQNFNRYSYVLNNPLSYTDPTGFFFSKLFKAIGRAFGKMFQAIGRALKKLLRSPIVRAIVQIIACSNPVTCVAASGAMAAAAGGSIGDVFKAMAMSFVQMGVWDFVGTHIIDPFVNGLKAAGQLATSAGKASLALFKGFVHGVVGGALSVAQGGNFLQGFASNALGAAAGVISSGEDIVLGTVISAAAGCAGAALSGGKCSNGAVTAAFAHLYNSHRVASMAAQAGSKALGTIGRGFARFGNWLSRLLGRVPGQVVSESTAGWSERAIAYQSQISELGRGLAYNVNGVRCDGFLNGVLLDAKGPGYATFVRNGQFMSWFRGADTMINQATRQIAAAGRTPIEWHVAEQPAAIAIRNLFAANNIAIRVVHSPVLPSAPISR